MEVPPLQEPVLQEGTAAFGATAKSTQPILLGPSKCTEPGYGLEYSRTKLRRPPVPMRIAVPRSRL